MKQDDIIKMAKQAGWTIGPATLNGLERFAALVAAHEREACAKVCDAVQKKNEDDGAWMWEARNCAAAIRARGEQ